VLDQLGEGKEVSCDGNAPPITDDRFFDTSPSWVDLLLGTRQPRGSRDNSVLLHSLNESEIEELIRWLEHSREANSLDGR